MVNQGRQGIAGLFAVFDGVRVIGFGGFNQGFLLAQIDSGNHACFVAHLGKFVSGFAGFKHALRQCHRFLGVQFVEMGFGNGGNQGKVGGITVRGYAEITLQCGLAVAADASEKVQLVGCCAQTDGVFAAGNAAAQTAYPSSGTAGVDARQQVVAGNHVLFAVDFGVQCGGAQVGIAFQRDVDKAVQARVGKEVLPAQVGGADTVVEGVVFEGFGNFNLRLFVFRDHGTGGQRDGCGDGTQYRFECLFVHKDSLRSSEIRVSGFQTTFLLSACCPYFDLRGKSCLLQQRVSRPFHVRARFP